MAESTFAQTFSHAAAVAERPLGALSVPRRLTLIAAVVIALLYSTGIHGKWRPTDDSLAYLVLGRSLATGEGYRFNGMPDNTFPPGFPVVLAGVYRAVGYNYWAFNALMVLCGLCTLAVMHASLKRLTDPATALLATVLTALGYQFFLNSNRILSDVPAALLFWLAVYASLRLGAGGRWVWLAPVAMLSAGAVLFRMAGLLLMGALAAGLLLDRRLMGPSWRRRLAGSAAAALPALATSLLLYALAHQTTAATPSYERFFQRLAQSEHGLVAAYLFQFAEGARQLPKELADLMTGQRFWIYGLLLVPVGLLGLACNMVRGRWLIPAVCLLYPLGLLLVTRADNAMRSRFQVPTQPLLLLAAFQGLTAAGVLWAARARRDPRWTVERLAPTLVAVLAGLTAAVGLPRVMRDAFVNAYHARTDRFYDRIRLGERGDLLEAAAAIERLPGTSGPVLTRLEDWAPAHLGSGRLTVRWPETDCKTAESARAVYRHAVEHAEADIFILPLARKLEAEPFIAELRRAFDDDPHWQSVFENRSYVVYVRARSTTSGRVEPPENGTTGGHR